MPQVFNKICLLQLVKNCMSTSPCELWKLFGLQLPDSLSLPGLIEFHLEHMQVSVNLGFSLRVLGVRG